jgi:hypothetical protein
VAAHALVWRWAVGTVTQQYGLWVQQVRSQGLVVTAGTPERTGWPFAAQIRLPDVSLVATARDQAASVSWTSEHILLGVALLHPRTLVIHFEGIEHVRLGQGPEVSFMADRLQATVPLEPGAPAREVDISGANVRADMPVGGTGGAGGMTIALLSLHGASKPAATQGEPALSFAGSAQDIGLPPQAAGKAWPLGPRIASISIEGALNGPLPQVADPVAKATGWRDGGGTLQISRFAIGWGPLGLNGSATLALDEHMQPMGTATAHIIGESEVLDAMAASGVITQRAALATKAFLGLMTKEPEGGGPPQVDVPLTLQDRKLAMGRIPIAVLPELVWPSARQ